MHLYQSEAAGGAKEQGNESEPVNPFKYSDESLVVATELSKTQQPSKAATVTPFRAAFDAFRKTRKAAGEKSFKIGHAVGQPNNLCLLFTWDSVDRAKAFLRSKALKATMQEAGLKERPEIHFFEDKAREAVEQLLHFLPGASTMPVQAVTISATFQPPENGPLIRSGLAVWKRRHSTQPQPLSQSPRLVHVSKGAS